MENNIINSSSNKVHCPKCGSENLQTVVKTNVQTQGKNYSASQGCLGYLMLGPLGLLCGSCGQNKTTTTTHTSVFACNDCGHEFRKKEDIINNIETTKKQMKVGSIGTGIMMFIICLIIGGITDSFGLAFLICIIEYSLVGAIMYAVYKSQINKANRELEEYENGQRRHF